MNGSALYGVLGFAAWIGATCGPMAIAIWFWRLAERVRPSWSLHLLFLPCVLATEWASVWVLFYSAGDDGDGPPGLGFALIPAVLLLMLSIVGYFIALLASQIAKMRHRA